MVFSMAWSRHMSVLDLVQASGIVQSHPDVLSLTPGIFARCVTWNTLVNPGDRVELYRPLLIDPKEKRRRQAKASTRK